MCLSKAQCPPNGRRCAGSHPRRPSPAKRRAERAVAKALATGVPPPLREIGTPRPGRPVAGSHGTIVAVLAPGRAVAWSDGAVAGNSEVVAKFEANFADLSDPVAVATVLAELVGGTDHIGGDLPVGWPPVEEDTPNAPAERVFEEFGRLEDADYCLESSRALRKTMRKRSSSREKAKATVARQIAGALGDRFDEETIASWYRKDDPHQFVVRLANGDVEDMTDEDLWFRGWFVARPGSQPDIDVSPFGTEIAPFGSPEALTILREENVSRIVGAWAETSNDHDVRSLTIQEAIREEFGLEETAEWTGLDDKLKESVAAYLEEKRPFYRAVIRAMYDATQADLAERGISHVAAYRGVNTPSKEWPAGMEGLGFVRSGDDVAVTLRPASSWSLNEETARYFATRGHDFYDYVVIKASVPASRVLATPFTGFGCMFETEVVVLGGNEVVQVHKGWPVDNEDLEDDSDEFEDDENEEEDDDE